MSDPPTRVRSGQELVTALRRARDAAVEPAGVHAYVPVAPPKPPLLAYLAVAVITVALMLIEYLA